MKLKVVLVSFLFSFIFISIQIGNFENKLIVNSNRYTENIEITNEKEGDKVKIENAVISIKEYGNIIDNHKIIYEWKIVIPKISLSAKIKSGTEPEILNEFVGHFKETQKENGNIGLAAHNRGYKVNYFTRLKELEIGDEIYYSYNGIEKIYIVNSKNIINDTDWKWLENTKDNRITLITCVEDKPKNRLCIQGIEKQN